MSTWKRKSIEAVPDLKPKLETTTNPMAAWIEIRLYFELLNLDKDRIRVTAILEYARWCVSKESGKLPNDTSTAACFGFYEHLPEREENWKYFPGWFSPNEFESLKGVFLYHIGEDKLKELCSVYYDRKSKRKGITSA